MKKLIATTLLCSLIAGAASYARTSWINLNSGIEDVEIWTAISDYSSNGTSELATMAANWTNQLGVGGDASVVVSKNYADGYLSPETQGASDMNFLLQNGVTVKVVSGGTLGLRTKTAAEDFSASTGYGEIIFDREGTLEVSGTGRVFAGSVTMNRSNYAQTLILKDQAYFASSGTTNIGLTTDTNAKVLSFRGSNIQLAQLRNLRFRGGEGTSIDDVKGGKLEWIADAKGITTVINNSSPQEAMTGVISVDFTNLLWDEDWGDSKTFTLLSCTGGSNYITEWVSDYSSTLGEIITANGRITDTELAYFSADNTKLYVTIAREAAVPEPGTCAALFGAVALAFAAYRRRK